MLLVRKNLVKLLYPLHESHSEKDKKDRKRNQEKNPLTRRWPPTVAHAWHWPWLFLWLWGLSVASFRWNNKMRQADPVFQNSSHHGGHWPDWQSGDFWPQAQVVAEGKV